MESLTRRGAAIALAGACLLLAAGGEISATIARMLSLAELSARSGLVVLGRVGELRVEWSPPPARYPLTVAAVEVLETLKGSGRPRRTIQVLQIGGSLEGFSLEFAGRPRLESGEEVVLFLRPSGNGSFVIVGMAQGVLHVVGSGDPRGPWLVRDLRGMAFLEEGAGEGVRGLPAAGGRIRWEEFREALRSGPSVPSPAP